jgi:hypothetical protein
MRNGRKHAPNQLFVGVADHSANAAHNIIDARIRDLEL